MATTLESKNDRLHLRTTRQQRKLIEVAASLCGEDMTDFVITSAYNRAEQVLADRRHFELPAERWKKFVAALDRRPVSKSRLRRLLSEPSILES
ncbi:MAG: DUF1778 domain-containing protein [Candidatus Korobacteraceae bacterium]|jgi:uncharacterized protein (DUF1778 family)